MQHGNIFRTRLLGASECAPNIGCRIRIFPEAGRRGRSRGERSAPLGWAQEGEAASPGRRADAAGADRIGENPVIDELQRRHMRGLGERLLHRSAIAVTPGRRHVVRRARPHSGAPSATAVRRPSAGSDGCRAGLSRRRRSLAHRIPTTDEIATPMRRRSWTSAPELLEAGRTRTIVTRKAGDTERADAGARLLPQRQSSRCVARLAASMPRDQPVSMTGTKKDRARLAGHVDVVAE